ncbi:TPA: hypothetical protein MII31_00445 [Klebsiella pneumoniae]|nr:hypothetical protein [Klebsiella pneumoniae]
MGYFTRHNYQKLKWLGCAVMGSHRYSSCEYTMLAGCFQRQLVNFWPLSLKKLYNDINDMEFKVIAEILCANNLKTLTVIQ